MLGHKIFVNILGTILEHSLYFGYFNFNGSMRKVYVVSDKPVAEGSVCTVIAEELSPDKQASQSQLVAAPDGEVFYEPEIRKRLESTSVKVEHFVCLYEKSCGAVVYINFKGDTKYLLVKNKNGRCWSFPKGHIEINENEKQTAKREIKEETGLDVDIKKDFRETGIYCPFGKTQKKVVFFLAEAKSDKVSIQQREIDDYAWVTMQQAKKMCHHENDIRVLEKVSVRLQKNSRNLKP